MAIIFRKTAKGVDEIQTRAHRLAPRSRNALILVDGQRSDEDLGRLIQLQAAETLQALAAGGFIEAVASAVAPATAQAPPAAPLRPIDVALVRREAVRRLTDLVGPAGEDLCIRMERCKDIDALRPLLANARQIIVNTRGALAAAQYINALSEL